MWVYIHQKLGWFPSPRVSRILNNYFCQPYKCWWWWLNRFHVSDDSILSRNWCYGIHKNTSVLSNVIFFLLVVYRQFLHPSFRGPALMIEMHLNIQLFLLPALEKTTPFLLASLYWCYSVDCLCHWNTDLQCPFFSSGLVSIGGAGYLTWQTFFFYRLFWSKYLVVILACCLWCSFFHHIALICAVVKIDGVVNGLSCKPFLLR